MYNYEKLKKMVSNKEDLSDERKASLLLMINKLEINKLPVIFNIYHLSNLIGIEYNTFSNLIYKRDMQYSTFYISKKHGGKRLIISPNADLAIVQNFIKGNILDVINIHKSAFGFVQKKDIIKNAQQHVGAEKILNMDLKDFFPSISYYRVFYIFYSLCGYSSNISEVLANLCIYKGVLPQGACTSPVISNIVSYTMDVRISNYCEKAGVIYTRYADDMTFSGGQDLITGNLLKNISKIVEDCGFVINSKKTRFATKKSRMEITGLIINNGKVSIQKRYIQEVRQELYYLRKYGVKNHQDKKGFQNHFYQQHLKGKILFIKQINQSLGAKLLESYNEVKWDE